MDDIALHKSRVIEKLRVDFNFDHVINYKDFLIFALRWLDTEMWP